MVPDGAVTAFWEAYWQCVQANAPELGLSRPGPKPRGSSYVYFKPKGLPPRTQLNHQMDRGFVNLEFAGLGDSVPELRASLGPFLGPDMVLDRASKSAAVRIRVPVLDHTAAFPPQEPLVIQALGAVRRLWQWAVEHSGRVRWK
jgi:hypothetical protein